MLGKIFRICNETGFGMYHGCRNMSSSPARADRHLDFEDEGTFGRGRGMLPPWVKAAMDLRQFGVRDARIYLSRDERCVSQQALNVTNVCPLLEQMGREGVSNHMRCGTS
jgi:hypothetical protein